MDHKDIAELITPRMRKRINIMRSLSDEEHFILSKKRKINSSFEISLIVLILLLIYFTPFSVAVQKYSLFTSAFISSLIFYKIMIPIILISLAIYIIFLFIDKMKYDYGSRARKIKKKIKKLNKKEKQKWI